MNKYWRLIVAGVLLVLWTGLTPAPGLFFALTAGFIAGLCTGRRDPRG